MDPTSADMMAGFDDYDNLKRTDCLTFGQEVFDSIAVAEDQGRRGRR